MEKKRSVIPNGDAVRSARLRKAWTTDDLSRRTDCAVKTIENAERGKAIYANTLARIASALEVDYESLIARPVARPVEQNKSTTLDPTISTIRVEATFVVLTRKDRPIDSGWFLDQLKSRVDFQDPIDVLSNQYYESPFVPDGGVWITFAMTVRDFEQVFANITAQYDVNAPYLKLVLLTAADIPNPLIPGAYLWKAPSLRHKLPYSHLYD